MSPTRVSRSGRAGRDSGEEPAVAATFTLLWEALTDLLGSATTAVLLRRAARRGAATCPMLVELVIFEENQEYRCTLPRGWKQPSEVGSLAMGQLVAELRPLLAELTGGVVVQHLARIPELRDRGIASAA